MNRILVVEDDGNLQLLYRSVLERSWIFSDYGSKWRRSASTIGKLPDRVDDHRHHDAWNGWV